MVTSTRSRTSGILVVAAEDSMDDNTFTKHMNARHSDSLGGLDELWFADEPTHEAWRAFHWRLHQLRIDLEHEHSV